MEKEEKRLSKRRKWRSGEEVTEERRGGKGGTEEGEKEKEEEQEEERQRSKSFPQCRQAKIISPHHKHYF